MKPHLQAKSGKFSHITNTEFLQAIFGNNWTDAVVTSFPGDPNDVARQAQNWSATPAGSFATSGFSRDLNNYFCISLFDTTQPCGFRRRKDLFKEACVLVVDDVKEKIDETKVTVLPSYKLETSPGSEQWGYILKYPEQDREVFEALVNALVDKFMLVDPTDTGSGDDPGMKGVTRYVRLPEGTNCKPKYGSPSPECILREWKPNLKYTTHELARAFGIDLTAAVTKYPLQTPSQTKTPVPQGDYIQMMLEDLGMVQSYHQDKLFIECPFIDEHTGRANTGAAYLPVGGFKCFHGHCIDKTPEDFIRALEDRYSLFPDKLVSLKQQEAANEFKFQNMFGTETPKTVVKEKAQALNRQIMGNSGPVSFVPSSNWGGTSFKPVPFLDANHVFLRGALTIFSGPPGAGKSTLLLDYIVSACLGKTVYGDWYEKGLNVLYISGDDDADTVRRRVSGCCQKHGWDASKLNGKLHTICVDDPGFEKFSFGKEKYKQAHVNHDVFNELSRLQKELNLDLIVVDPLANVLGIPENDNTMLMVIMRHIQQLTASRKIGFGFADHHRKSATTAIGDHLATQDDVRGGGAKVGASRIVIGVQKMSENEAISVGINPKTAWRYLSMHSMKSSHSPPMEERNWFHMESITIGTGEGLRPAPAVGVAIPWKYPSTDPTDMDIAVALNILKRGPQGTKSGYLYTVSSRSTVSPYLGDALKSDAKMTEALIKNTIRKIVEDGLVQEEMYKDPVAGRSKYKGHILSQKGEDVLAGK